VFAVVAVPKRPPGFWACPNKLVEPWVWAVPKLLPKAGAALLAGAPKVDPNAGAALTAGVPNVDPKVGAVLAPGAPNVDPNVGAVPPAGAPKAGGAVVVADPKVDPNAGVGCDWPKPKLVDWVVVVWVDPKGVAKPVAVKNTNELFKVI